MRSDLNKQLCERERHGHAKDFGEYRRSRAHDEAFDYNADDGLDEPFRGVGSGHRESMKKRYGYDRKQFNENLRPLYGFIHKSVGRKWDDVYSEICSNFDKRSVINQHILIHLFQYVGVDDVIVGDDNKVYHRRFQYGANDIVPINASYYKYYVDPRDGILKYNKYHQSYRQKWREEEKRRQEAELAVRRVISDDLELHNIDGSWFEIKYETIKGEREVVWQTFSISNKKYMRERTVYPPRYDVLHHTHMDVARVAVSKRQLSHKELKKYNLI